MWLLRVGDCDCYYVVFRTLWSLGSILKISEAAFKIAGSIILLLVALEMLAAKRQQRKRMRRAPENP